MSLEVTYYAARPWHGGVGANYAPCIVAQPETTTKRSFQQILWLFGEQDFMTKVGTMNFTAVKNRDGKPEL